MNKKGFTLIELLAVIVILAIITLVAVPVISNVIVKANLKSLTQSANGLLNAANLYYSENVNATTVRFDIDEGKITSRNAENSLVFRGTLPNEGTVLINKNGSISLCLTDGSNSAYKNYDDKTIITANDQICSIPANTYIVWLDDERTIDELSNQELMNEIDDLKSAIQELQRNHELLSELTAGALDQFDEVSKKIYPVGSIYMSMTDDTVAKVKEKFGGTWEKIENRFLLAQGSSYAINTTGGSATTTLAVGNLPSHTHSIPALSGTAASNGAHTHTLSGTAATGGAWSFGTNFIGEESSEENGVYGFTGTTTASVGSGAQYNISSSSYTKKVTATSVVNHAGHTHTLSGTAASNGAHTHSVTTTASTTGSQGSGSSFTNMPPYVTVYVYKRVA